jgi:hypothetical protein
MKAKLHIKIKQNFVGKERNLFIISTLFQLLSAIEAQKSFKTKNNILVLLYYGNHNKDQMQIEKFLSYFEYSKLIILDKGNSKSYINANIRLINELKKETYDFLFAGFFSANFRRFIVNLTYKELFLIDDGVYTIFIHNELYNHNAIGYKKYILPFSEKQRKSKIKKIKFMLYHWFRIFYLNLHGLKNDMKNKDINFFTIFDLTKYKNEKIIIHNFDYIKNIFNLLSHEVNDNTIYFLGQPLQRSLGIKDEQYIKYLRILFDRYKKDNKKITYIPHRAEKNTIYEIVKEMDVNLLQIEEAFEIYCLKYNIIPYKVASFHSTALFSVKKLFNNTKIDAFQFEVEKKLSKNLLLIYDFLKKENITVHKIL